MLKTVFVRARISPNLKLEAEYVLDKLGITASQAVVMLYKKIVMERSWPLELKIPNAKTRQVMNDTDNGIGIIKPKNIDELFKQLEI